jgi:hypothetical protein
VSTQAEFPDIPQTGPRGLAKARADLVAAIAKAREVLERIQRQDFLDNTDYWEETLADSNESPDYAAAEAGANDERWKWHREGDYHQEDNDTMSADAAYSYARELAALADAFHACRIAREALKAEEQKEVNALKSV